MLFHSRRLLTTSILAVCAMLSPVPALTAEPVDWLPETTLAYVEIPRPAELIKTVWEHPLKDHLQKSEQYKQMVDSPDFQPAQLVVNMLEEHFGTDLVTVLKSITKHGIYAGFDPATDGVAVFIHSENEEVLEKARQAAMNLAGAAALGGGQAIKTNVYRDIKVYQAGEGRIAILKDWLLLVNKPALGKSIADAYLDGGKGRLAQNQRFQQAKAAAGQHAAWMFVDIGTLRSANQLDDLLQDRHGNPAAELLLGGVADTLKKTPFATLSLDLTAKRLSAQLSVPHEDDWVSEPRRFFFGTEGKSTAPPLLDVPGTILSLSTYRDFREVWRQAGDLFNDEVLDGMAEAESGLTTFFSGKDFGEDILGAIEPEVQFVVTRQTFENAEYKPAIRIPSFALVSEMRDPEELRAPLRRTFQSLIGFLNVVNAMNGNPQLDMDMIKGERQQMVATYYVPEKGLSKKNVPIYYNFSPTLVFVGDKLIISSTTALAKELAKDGATSKASANTNTAIHVNAPELKSALDDNKRHLVAQNMLEEGNTRAEAEQEIDLLLAIVDFFDDMAVQLDVADKKISLDFSIGLKQ